MASWDPAAELEHPVDFRLAMNGPVTMFWRWSVLSETIDWLRLNAYRVVELHADSWSSAGDMFNDAARAMDFPDYFGRNLDALNDCMSDVASGDYGWDVEADTGLVIVLKRFDAFASVDRSTAQKLLDIFANQARSALLIGHRIICLAQSNDPRLSFDPVGATPVTWNDQERLDSSRGM
ncbi:barstar family protein [Nocardioides jiangxiensis]|uniref:Barstar family protein n=1 Tax=Nocardioides jiangxiensis TaxID=3064524 RepID=A0ABT9B3Z6_9ACTN|nr:barstar family protein [Nocardioides sp. WY-20]MDO7869561.1 barstar family protein [Nocardioides sp. WY-20]